MTLKSVIESACVEAGYAFVHGSKIYVNKELEGIIMKDGAVFVNLLPFKETVEYNGIKVNRVRYDCILQIGMKFSDDNSVHSNLDETYSQKYDNRLSGLYDKAWELVKGVTCSNNLEPINYEAQGEINQYSSLVDLVAVSFGFYSNGFLR